MPLFRFLLFPALALWLLVGTSCHPDENYERRTRPTHQAVGAPRSVLVYMAAQNTLGSSDFHHKDSAEILAGRQYIPEGGHLFLFIDDSRPPGLYEVLSDVEKPQLVHQWESDVCSTDPTTLQEVLERVQRHAPSPEYGLVMWSHSDGWIPASEVYKPYSFGIDCGTPNLTDRGPQMNITDMAQAILNSGVHLRYIFFDACMMQNIEVAWALRRTTDYVIGGPCLIPGNGANYTHQMRYGLFSINPCTIVKQYHADVTDPAQEPEYKDVGIAFSAIRTQALPAVAQTLNEVLPHSRYAGDFVHANLENATGYSLYSSRLYFRPHNYDAAQALQCILPAADCEKVKRALEEAVERCCITEKIWGGIGEQYYQVDVASAIAVSMFVPQAIYTTNASRCRYGDLNERFRETEWYRDAGWSRVF